MTMAVTSVMKGQIIRKTARTQNHLIQGEEAEDGESANVEAGEEVFQNNCASCHGKDLSGAAGPNLTEIGSNYSQDEIADIDENGTDEGMPAFPDIEDNDLDEFAKWLSEHK